IENGLQHFQRVTTPGQMVRDDQGDKAYRACTSSADPITKDSLENQRDDDRTPSDENRGGIKICDRRALLQVHSRNQPEGVNGECKQKKIKCGAIEDASPTEPGKA